MQDEPSETESDILAKSKNLGKLSKKKLKISPKVTRKKQVQEDRDLKKRGDGGKVGLHSSKQKKKKLKNDITSSSMEL